MPKPRRECVSLDITPYYHCISRCVRRAFLCGRDKDKNFEHRREWIESRILELQQFFCIDVCAYAVMSNHYHVVLHVNIDELNTLTSRDILSRWGSIFTLPLLAQRYLNHSPLHETEQAIVDNLVETYASRLADISWFMRCLNEPIARMANQEDNCTGRFWEGRFKVQALLDEAALLTCMAYVDLNPVRANMAETPETSEFTSIKTRVFDPEKSRCLFPFSTPKITNCIPFSFQDYLELVDWTGRAIRNDKRGAINKNTPPILERLNINQNQWIKQQPLLEKNFPHFVGQPSALKQACETLRRKWIKGRNFSQLLFN